MRNLFLIDEDLAGPKNNGILFYPQKLLNLTGQLIHLPQMKLTVNNLSKSLGFLNDFHVFYVVKQYE